MQPQPASRRPEAARIRLREGGRVRVELAGGRSPARLIARLRSGDAQVAVPVVPGEEGPVADLHLPAGDGGVQLWDLQVERSDGRASRLFDGRESAKTEWVAAGPGRVLSAVRTAKGNAALRLAPAPPAAEVREVRPSENGFLLSGRVRELPDLTDGVSVVAVPREEGDEVVVPSTFDGDRFSAQVPYALLSGHGRWDLALRLSGEGAARCGCALGQLAMSWAGPPWRCTSCSGTAVTCGWSCTRR